MFGRFRIDGVAIFGVPAEGPHGFYAMGRYVSDSTPNKWPFLMDVDAFSTVESTMRSLNNLLERFHQSFFLYLFVYTGHVHFRG